MGAQISYFEKRLGKELNRLGEDRIHITRYSRSELISLDNFLNEMKANQHLFCQPLQLMKLQNILNRLKKETKPSSQVQGWQKEVQSLMENISSNMQIRRQESMIHLLERWEDVGDVRNAVSETFYRELSTKLR